MRAVDVELLDSFVRVAESRSLTEAARLLFLSQPTLTARVRALERELGVDLFQRGGGRLRLSPAGEHLLPLARRAVTTLDQLRTAARDYQEGVMAPPVLLASSTTLSQSFLPKCLHRFLSQNPSLRVSVLGVHGSEVPRLVRTGAANLGLVHLPRDFRPSDLLQTSLYPSPMVPVARPGHRLAGRRVRLAELHAYPLVTFCEDSPYWTVLARWFRRLSYSPPSCVRLNHIRTMEEVVLQTAGVSFLPADMVEEDLRAGRLAPVDLGERLPCTFVRVMHQGDATLTPAAVRLLACLREQARTLRLGRRQPGVAASAAGGEGTREALAPEL